MDGKASRKPRARPPPPARKQSLPALDSVLDEDIFDEDLAPSPGSPQLDGGLRRARSERPHTLTSVSERKSPLGHAGWPGHDATEASSRAKSLTPRTPVAPTTPSMTIVSSPNEQPTAVARASDGDQHQTPPKQSSSEDGVASVCKQQQQALPIPSKRTSTRSRDSSPSRAPEVSVTTPPAQAAAPSSRPRPVFQLPGPPKSPAPGKIPRASPGGKSMASPSSLQESPGDSELKSTLKAVQDKLAAAESQLEAQKSKDSAEIESLREEVDQLKADKISENGLDFSQEVVDLQAKVSELQAASRRCQALEKKLAAAEELASLAEEDAHATRDEVSTVRQQLKDAQQRLKSSGSLSRNAKADEERLKTLEATNSALKEEVEGLEGEKALVLSDYDTIAAEVQTLRAKSADRATEDAELAKLAGEREEAANAAKVSMGTMAEQIASLESQLQAAQVQRTAAEEKVKTLSEQSVESSDQCSEIAELREQLASKDNEVQEGLAANDSLAEQLVVQGSDLEHAKKELEVEKLNVTTLKAEVSEKEESEMSLIEEVSKLNQSLLMETSRCSELQSKVLCLEKEKVNLADQLKQLKPVSSGGSAGGGGGPSPSKAESSDASPVSVRSAVVDDDDDDDDNDAGVATSQSAGTPTTTDDGPLSVTPSLTRADTGSLSVGEVTRNEVVVDTTDLQARAAQPKAEPSSNKASPATVRTAASGTPPVVAPYSVHKKRSSTSSRESTPETSPDTPRKDEASPPSKPGEINGGNGLQEKPVTSAFTSKQPHSFMKANATSGMAALAAVMSGVGSKVGPVKDATAAKPGQGESKSGTGTPKLGATPTSSPGIPKRPAPTAKPRARGPAPMPPTAKRDTPPADKSGDADAKSDVSPTEPASAISAGVNAAVKASPKPSPKIARKPPPARAVPLPPKKAVSALPQQRDGADADGDAEANAEANAKADTKADAKEGESTEADGQCAGCLGDVAGEFDSISPATMKKLGTTAGRERVRLGAQGGLAGRRKPTRTHLRGADSGDELSQSDAEALADDSGGQSSSESPLAARATPATAAASSALAAAAAAAVVGRSGTDSTDKATTSASPRPHRGGAATMPAARGERSATVSLGQATSTTALSDRQRHSLGRGGGDADAIDEAGGDDEDGHRVRRAKTLAGNVGLPLGGFLPPGAGGPVRPSDLKKGTANVAKPARKPAPTPPGRTPPPAPDGTGSGGSSRPESTASLHHPDVNGEQSTVATPMDEDRTTDEVASESRGASDDEHDDNEDSGGDDAMMTSPVAGQVETRPVTSPSSDSIASPQHTADGDGGFSFSRESRRSGLRTTMDWSVEEVTNWLHLMDLPDVGPIFTKFHIDGRKLLALDGMKLKTMGVTNPLQVASLKKEIKTMKSQVDKMMKDEKKRLEREAKLEKKRREDEAKLMKRYSKKRK